MDNWALGSPGSGNICTVPKEDEFFFLKNLRHPRGEIISYSHSLKPYLPVTHSSSVSKKPHSSPVSSPAKNTLSGQGYGFCWWRR